MTFEGKKHPICYCLRCRRHCVAVALLQSEVIKLLRVLCGGGGQDSGGTFIACALQLTSRLEKAINHRFRSPAFLRFPRYRLGPQG